MGGKLGTDAIKKEITMVKLGAIAFFQAVSKDGFQAKDLAAPLASPSFQQAVIGQTETFILAVQESKELDGGDMLSVIMHTTSALKDVGTEAMLALRKIQSKV